MNPVTLVRALSFLSRTARPAGSIPPIDPVVTGARGAVYDLYEAAHGRKAGQTAILLHGITFEGRRDERLMNFASALSRSGVTCLVPELPGLASGRFIADDVDIVRSLSLGTFGEKRRKVIIVGFSMGASYGLLAAGGEAAGAVSHVIAFGPYHSLPALIDYWRAFGASDPSGPDDRDNLIYLALVSAYTMRAGLGIGETEAAEMRSLLERYCNRASIEEKEAFYDRRLRRIDPGAAVSDELGPGAALALSPEGKLGGISALVHCIHDMNDSLVPAEHSRRIITELAAAGRRGDRLLCTTLLSHVSAAPVGRIGELMDLCAALGPLFG